MDIKEPSILYTEEENEELLRDPGKNKIMFTVEFIISLIIFISETSKTLSPLLALYL